jgi:hypothetical protein
MRRGGGAVSTKWDELKRRWNVAVAEANALTIELEQTRALLKDALELIERHVDDYDGNYGGPMTQDPRHFTPDEERSTEEERAAHAAAVERWSAGDEVKTDFGGWIDFDVTSEDVVGAKAVLRATDGTVVHIDKQPWGLGTSKVPTGAKELKERLRAALGLVIPTPTERPRDP